MVKICWLLLSGGWLCLPGGQSRAAGATLEAGHPFLQNFTPRDYHAQAQIWAGTQDPSGLLYFGTKACVLEYDGVSWRKIGVGTPIDVVHSLTTDPATGTVFVGGTNELGYLRGTVGGEKEFVSLLGQLPTDARDGLREIYGAYATAEGIVFVANRQIMRWRDGQFKVWKMPGKFRVLSGFANGKVYIQNPERGLLRLDGDELVRVSKDPVFDRAFMLSVCPAPEGAVVVSTLRDGAYTVRPDGVATPLPESVNTVLKGKEIRASLRLPDGSLAFGTNYAGVVVVGKDNRFADQWDETSGLQNNSLLNMFADRDGGVWLCLDVGITHVEAGGPLTIFDAGKGLKRESIQYMARINGGLTLATSTGLYRVLRADPDQAATARCERVPGVDGNFVSVCEFDGGLLASGLPGVCQLDRNGKLTTIYTNATTSEALCRSRENPDRVYLGTFAGLRSLRFDRRANHWEDEGEVPGVTGEIRTLVEDDHGQLWAGSYDKGAFRVIFSPDGADGKRGAGTVTSLCEQPGALHGQVWCEIRRWGGGVLVYTKAGLYRSDPAKGDLVSASEYGARFTNGSFRLESAAPDEANGVWLVGRNAQGLWLEQEAGRAVAGQGGGAATYRPLPHKISDRIDDIEGFVPEEDGIVWITGSNGLVRLDARQWASTSSPAPLTTLVRRSVATDQSQAGSPAQPILKEALPAGRNSVKFEFAADTFAIGAGVRYQTRLVGSGAGQWSEPGERTSAEYANLWEGSYVFEVRASDGDGRPGTVAALPFRILPPWQRSPWAYALYVPLLAAGAYGLLRWQLRRLRSQNARLEGVVSARTEELRAHERELVRARDDAEAANRAKSAFLANMSHELRTPLNAILGYTQIMLKETELSPRNRERLAVVSQSGGYLLTMINEVLDLSKIEAGKLTLEPADFRLSQVLDEVSATFRPKLLEKGLEFRSLRAADLPEIVHSDADKLRQVLFNLFSNAVKFTRHGTVALEVTRVDGGRVQFAVVDTGAGIAAEELRNIFVAFHQSGDSKLAAQGTGLGLTISQRLVGLLGGQMRVESTPGEGSRFSFELGLPPVVPHLVMPPVAHPEDYQRIMGYDGARRTLLVVDDEPANRYVLRGLLEPLGFEIEEAADGVECLEHCARQLPDGLLLDLRMDRLDGFEVARRLRAGPGGADARIIAVSASVYDDHRQQAIDAGCDDFLPKPFREDQLLAVLGRVLGLQWRLTSDEGLSDHDHDTARGDLPPPPEEIDALLELSRRGDILGIRKRLGALQAAGQHRGCRTLARGLEPLVAGYQMDRIRDVLIRFKENGPA